MIDYVSGTLVSKSPDRIVIDVGGVGISLLISLSTYNDVGQVGSVLKLFTHLYLREPTIELYGFSTVQEREVFRLLIQVSGVGVRLARTILSGMRPDQVRNAIAGKEVSRLAGVPGVGKKTAERLVVFLRDKAASFPLTEAVASPEEQLRRDAQAALVSLGITPSRSQQAVLQVIKEKGPDISLDALVKEALRSLF